MEIVLANISGKTRRATLNGREFIVADATLIVPGVLNGSKGRLYYPPDEVGKDPWAWNGMPLIGYHPTMNGQHISGRDPDVLSQSGLGYFYRAKVNGKLGGEAWFDIDATRNFDKTLDANIRILPRLERGERIELSTGLFTDNEPTAGVDPTGKPYDAIARNYRPDHVAVLPDQVGACSVQDGCGINVNGAVENAFCPTGEGGGVDPTCKPTNSESGSVDRSKFTGTDERGQKAIAASDKAEKLSAIAVDKESHRSAAIAHRKAGEAHYFVGESHGDIAVRAGMRGTDKELIERAYRLRHAHIDQQRFHEAKAEFHRAAAKQTVNANAETDAKLSLWQKLGEWLGITNRNDKTGDTTVETNTEVINEESDMDRAATIKFLVANCDCWKGKDKVLANKETFTDDDLAKLKASVEASRANAFIANAATQGVQLGAATLVFNSEKGNYVVRNADGEECEPGDKKCVDMVKEKPVANTTANAQAPPKTDAEWLASAPPGIQAAVRNAMAVEQQEKHKLIGQLTANVTDDGKRKALVQRFSAMALPDLRDLTAMLPAPSPQESFSGLSPIYVGANAPANNQHDDTIDDSFALPVMNYEGAASPRLLERLRAS